MSYNKRNSRENVRLTHTAEQRTAIVILHFEEWYASVVKKFEVEFEGRQPGGNPVCLFSYIHLQFGLLGYQMLAIFSSIL